MLDRLGGGVAGIDLVASVDVPAGPPAAQGRRVMGADAGEGRRALGRRRPDAAVLLLELQHRAAEQAGIGAARSDEHTSELQSLIRLSYAVFCFTNTTNIINYRAIT